MNEWISEWMKELQWIKLFDDNKFDDKNKFDVRFNGHVNELLSREWIRFNHVNELNLSSKWKCMTHSWCHHIVVVVLNVMFSQDYFWITITWHEALLCVDNDNDNLCYDIVRLNSYCGSYFIVPKFLLINIIV